MAKYIFVILSVLSMVLIGLKLHRGDFVDGGMWADQATFFLTKNPELYDFRQAYGHPGGPVIEAEIAIHTLTGIKNEDADIWFLSIFGGILIGGICTLCYILRRNVLWSVAVFGLLTLNPLFSESTPPSILVAYLLTFLIIFTLYLLEGERLNWKTGLLWSVIAGMAVATRTDVASVTTATLGILLIIHYNYRKVAALAAASIAFFCLFDPFMWYMPIKHVQDLLYKVIFHYSDFPQPNQLSLMDVSQLSALAAASLALAWLTIAFRRKLKSPYPVSFVIGITVLTILEYTIFLTSAYQADRYFLPIVCIWQVLLPYTAFYLISHVEFTFLSPGKQ